MKRKDGNPSLRSVTRIRDVRYPGILIRVTELKRDGPLFYARQINGKPKYQKIEPECTWISLSPTNKKRTENATALALDYIRMLAEGSDDEEPSGPDLTLGGLIKRFETDGLHGRTERYKNGMLTAVKRVRDYLGADLAVRDLRPSHVQKYLAHRSGVLVAGHRDLISLSIVINWACGEQLLDVNPLGTKPLLKAMHSDHKPRRVVVTPERYEKLKAVAEKLPPAFGVLLDLAWAAGHRVSAMLGARDGEFAGLRWRDVSFTRTEACPCGSIVWYRGLKADRKKHEHPLPMNQVASATLARWRKETGGVGTAFVFSDPRDRTKPLSYYDAKRWLRRAETRAGLEHERQGGWHALRRGWATARKHLPLKDVMEVGGWTDTATLAEVYQQPDAATTRRVALHVA